MFCQLAAKALATNPETKVCVAVCHKEHAPDFLKTIDVRVLNPRASENELQALEAKYKGRTHLVYAMMVAETLSEHLPALDKFSYCPDDLNEGQRVLEHIVTYRLLIQDERDTELNRVEKKKEMQGGLDFADMVAGAVWEAYEKGDKSFLDILNPYITIKEFHSPPVSAVPNILAA